MEIKKETLVKGGFVTAFMCLSIGLEFLYRDPLFEISLKLIENIQFSSSDQFKIYEVFTILGTASIVIPILIIVFLWFPINKSFSLFIVYIFCAYWDNLLKIIYGNPRPYWVKTSLFKQCNGGYGNPSGHAFTSAGFYLATWELVTSLKYFKENKIGVVIKWILLIVSVILILFIMYTRIILGAHSLNQILYGASLGLVVYLAIFKVIELHETSLEDIELHINDRKSIIIYSIIYCVLFLIGLIFWACLNNEVTEYTNNVSNLCPNLNAYRKFNDDGFYQILSIFGLVGAHFGLVFLFKQVKKIYPNKLSFLNEWYKGSFLSQFYRVLLCILFGSPLILTFVISGNSSLGIIFIFKVSLPYLLAMFNLFGPCIFFSIKYRICNPEIWTENSVISNNKIQIEM
jgi:membrane-associated phospholipid phosphatase